MNFNVLIQKVQEMGKAIGLIDILKLWRIVNNAINTVRAIKGFSSDGVLTDAEAAESARLFNVLMADLNIPMESSQSIWIVRGCWAIYKLIKK